MNQLYTTKEMLAEGAVNTLMGNDTMRFIERDLLIREAMYPQALVLAKGPGLRAELLSEGIDSSTVKSVARSAIAGAAEYGLGAITLPAGGAGLAVGPAVDTAIDALFGAKEVENLIKLVTQIQESFNEFSSLVSQGYKTFKVMKKDLDAFYRNLVITVKKAIKLIGDVASETADDVAMRLKEMIKNAIDKTMESVKAGIKIVIPDAATGLAVSEAIHQILTKLAERPFDLMKFVIDRVEFLKNAVADPSIAIDFFDSLLDQLFQLLREFVKAAGDGKLKTPSPVVFGGPNMFGPSLPDGMGLPDAFDLKVPPTPTQLLLKTLGPGAVDKLEEYKPTLLLVIDKVLNVVVPFTITMVAIWQILTTGDYKNALPRGPQAEIVGVPQVNEWRGSQMGTLKLDESALRRLVRGVIAEGVSLQEAETAEVAKLKAEITKMLTRAVGFKLPKLMGDKETMEAITKHMDTHVKAVKAGDEKAAEDALDELERVILDAEIGVEKDEIDDMRKAIERLDVELRKG